jgi:hypothetical protein
MCSLVCLFECQVSACWSAFYAFSQSHIIYMSDPLNLFSAVPFCMSSMYLL